MVLYAAIYLVSKLIGISSTKIRNLVGFPWWSSGSNSPSNAGASGLIPGQGTKNLINSKLMENLINSKPVHRNYQTGAHEGPCSTIRETYAATEEEPAYCNEDPAAARKTQHKYRKRKLAFLRVLLTNSTSLKTPSKLEGQKLKGPAKLQVRSWAGDISSKCRSYLPGQQQLERASPVTSGIKNPRIVFNP